MNETDWDMLGKLQRTAHTQRNPLRGETQWVKAGSRAQVLGSCSRDSQAEAVSPECLGQASSPFYAGGGHHWGSERSLNHAA